jgi:multiple sugar transport system ATP-binding protein
VAELVLRGLRKRYPDGTEAVRGVDLAIGDGELVTLVGPSGCGKSTLLNLVAGLDQPSAGTIEIDGEVVNQRSPHERHIAMVFQSYALYPHMSVRRNLGFPLRVARLPRAEIAARVDEMAQRLGIASLLERRPAELSGGQRQRVALGRALVRRPKLCLFDEPLSNLDVGLRAELRGELKQLHADLQATFLYVTHDQAEAMTLSSRVVVLRDGVAEQIGPPREVYQRPVNTFVAGFLGTPRINLARPETLAVPAHALAPAHGRDAIAGLRPDKLEVLAREPDQPLPVTLAGRITAIELTGAETWVTAEIGGERVIGRAGADYVGRPGERVCLRYHDADLLLFDRATERALA